MAINQSFRRSAVKELTNEKGVYALCDLDGVPLYVGQSLDGIRSRVNRHLTSARSDIIANRMIDVWEIAWVLAYPLENPADIPDLEAALFQHFDVQSKLMNGKLLGRPAGKVAIPQPKQKIQVMSSDEIEAKRDPALRLPRQAEHYSQIVGHFLAVKNSKEIARAIQAHFVRLSKYHKSLLRLADDDAEDA